MINIRGTQDIYISRGDNKRIGINLIQTGGAWGPEDYAMSADEYIIFKLWDKQFRRVIKKLQSDAGSTIIDMRPEFTADIVGEFAYSVDLMSPDGTKETVIGKQPTSAPKFVVMEA